MTTLDERVAFLEGKVEEHSRGFGELREAVLHLDQKLDRRLDAMDQKIDHVDQKLDRLIAGVNGRIDGVHQRIDGLDQKITRLDGKVDQRIAGLDDKMSRQFLWILGVQIAVLIAVIGALAGA